MFDRNRKIKKFAFPINALRCYPVMPATAFLTTDEVSTRYRGEISAGTLRNWRSMKIGPSFLKIGKAVLYPLAELEAWDRKNLVICRAIRTSSGTELETSG